MAATAFSYTHLDVYKRQVNMSEVAPLISDLAIILIIAGIVTVIFKWLKQPVILGYICLLYTSRCV